MPTVAVGAIGVPVKVGESDNTTFPVPVSSVTAEARLAEDGVARNVATPVPSDVIAAEYNSAPFTINAASSNISDVGVYPRSASVEVATAIILLPFGNSISI